MGVLSVEVYGATEAILNELVNAGYAKTKTEAIRQAIIHLGQELDLMPKRNVELEDEWKKYAAKKALEDWDDAHKLFKF